MIFERHQSSDERSRPAMSKRTKLWTGLGIAAMSGVMVAHGAAIDGPPKSDNAGKPKLLLLADSSGEGGEAGGATGSAERIDYLTDLGLIEGHVRVGLELFKLGDTEAAKAHMKHPGDELYGEIKGHFAELKVKGFADELAATAAVVELGGSAAEAMARLEGLRQAIAASRGSVPSSAETAAVVAGLVRHAADDYALGVKDGKAANPHDYQDAWGFVQTAMAMLSDLPAAEREEHAGPIGEIEVEFAKMKAAWPEMTGKSPVTADPSLLAGAAATIELAAGSIK